MNGEWVYREGSHEATVEVVLTDGPHVLVELTEDTPPFGREGDQSWVDRGDLTQA